MSSSTTLNPSNEKTARLKDFFKQHAQSSWILPSQLVDKEEEEETDLQWTVDHIVQGAQQSGPLMTPMHHDATVLSKEKAERIAQVHNSIRGHHGIARTVEMLQRETQNQEWLYMRQHVRIFIEHCPFCQKMKNIKTIIQTHPFTTSTYTPMNRLNVDTIGPLLEDEKGNMYIIVFVDCFSRFCELYAVPTTDAHHCARCLIDFIGRYGAPRFVLSDRGSQFVNELIAEVFKILNSEHILSMSYSKEENALVERANAEVMRHLRAIVFDTRLKNQWSLSLPLVQRILNSTTKESIGVSPAQLIFGNALDLDRNLFQRCTGKSSESLTPTIRQYIDNLLSVQAKVLQIAQTHQLKNDHSNLSKKEGKEEPKAYPPDSFVLLRYPAGLGNDHRPPSKLHTKWQGPFRVISNIGDSYTIQNMVTMKSSKHHIKELTPFRWNAELVDPREVALTDRDEFVIEKVIDHRGDLTKKSSLTFKVRWQGYSAEEDTWEPWSQLRDTEALHVYLRSINKGNMIPKKFQN